MSYDHWKTTEPHDPWAGDTHAEDEEVEEATKCFWLCGCGNGNLLCELHEVPDFCGLCGNEIRVRGERTEVAARLLEGGSE